MCVDRHVSGCAGQASAFTVGKVNFSLRVSVLLRHAEIWITRKSGQQAQENHNVRRHLPRMPSRDEIQVNGKPQGKRRLEDNKSQQVRENVCTNYMNNFGSFRAGDANEKVIRLDIPINKRLVVN